MIATESERISRQITSEKINALSPLVLDRRVKHVWSKGENRLAEIFRDPQDHIVIRVFNLSEQDKPYSETLVENLAGNPILIGSNLPEDGRKDMEAGAVLHFIQTPHGNPLDITLQYPDIDFVDNTNKNLIMYGTPIGIVDSGVTLNIIMPAS